MDIFSHYITLLRRNDPIISSLSFCAIKLTNELVDVVIDTLKKNQFVSKIVLQSNSLDTHLTNKFIQLLLSNPQLTHLEINYNNVDDNSIEFLKCTLLKLSPNRQKINLVLRNNIFGPKGAKYLADAISANVPIQQLDLRSNINLTDEGVEKICLALSNNNTLTNLDLIKCGCSELGAMALSDSLINNETLNTLLIQDELNFNAVSSIGQFLADDMCRLQSLYLWHCELDSQQLQCLCRSLKNNVSLRTLALSYNKIDDFGGLSLSQMLTHNETILKLHLGANLFTPTSAGFFGVALAKNKTLQFIDLSRNFFRSVGVWPLAVSLTNNTSLKSLDLRYNRIDSSGAEILAELLKFNTSITVLRLSGNNLGDNAVSLLATTITGNEYLKDLEINDINMTTSGFVDMCTALMSNKVLERIQMNENQIASGALSKLAELMKANSTLKLIGIADCEIYSEGCQHIAEGIAANSSLSALDLSNNKIDIVGMKHIAEALTGNYAMEVIHWIDNPFVSQEGSKNVLMRITDCLERNKYYMQNMLMRDMSALATDPTFV